jgi:hypothetical protein
LFSTTAEVFKHMNKPAHNDLLGQPLEVGDCVVFPNTNHMLVGIVNKLHPKMVSVRRVDPKWSWTMNKYPNALVKVQGAEVTMYLLKNSKSS